jgi:hypothetical protein
VERGLELGLLFADGDGQIGPLVEQLENLLINRIDASTEFVYRLHR